MRVAFDNGEGAGVLSVLHDEPGYANCISIYIFLERRDPGFERELRCSGFVEPKSHHLGIIPSESLLVVGVDLAGLLKLGDQLVDALLVIFGVEVDDECVDHVCDVLFVFKSALKRFIGCTAN